MPLLFGVKINFFVFGGREGRISVAGWGRGRFLLKHYVDLVALKYRDL